VARSRFDAGHIDETELERALQGGTPDEHIHAVIDVVDLIDVKLAALKAHRSQIPADWFLLTVPDEVRPVIMGRETFVRVFSHVAAAPKEDDLFAGLR
jgi:LmbE family N-acetylglucosaminyl deacetylase